MKKTLATNLVLLALVLGACAAPAASPMAASPTPIATAAPTPTPSPAPTPEPPPIVPTDPSMMFYGATELSVTYSYGGDFADDYVPYTTADPYLLALFIAHMSAAEPVDKSVFDQANRYNKEPAALLLTLNGQEKEITVAIDTLYENCVFAYEDSYYRTNFAMGRYLQNLESYRPETGAVPADICALLAQHGWQAAFAHAWIPITLPDNLLMEQLEYPDKLYWSHNLILSRHVGLDFTAYLGKQVTAEMIRLVEAAPMEGREDFNADAVILRAGGEILGAYISSGRHYAFSTALDRSAFEDIAGEDFFSWFAENGYDAADPQYAINAALSPEEVVRAFIGALVENDDSRHQYLSANMLTSTLFSNMPNSTLYNKQLTVATVNSAQVISVSPVADGGREDALSFAVTYEIDVDASELNEAYHGQVYIVFTVIRAGDAGWKIDSMGH